MAKTTTQASKPTRRNIPVAPLKLFQQTFCKYCSDREYCRIHKTMMQNCILTLIADELAHTRQIIQRRTQHLSW